MIRVLSLTLFVAAVTILAERSAHAQLPVAPPPREVRPDGSRDPVPQPEPVKTEDPAVVVDRIIKNSKDVGDKLAATDTGKETRKTQDKILSDIDSLINRQENPPPPQSNDSKDPMKNMDPMNNKQPMDGKDPMKKDPMMKDGMPQPKDPGNMDKGMKPDMMPMDGMNNQQQTGNQPMQTDKKGNGRRPRTGDQPMGGDKQAQKSDPKDPMNTKDGKGKDSGDKKEHSATSGGNPGGKASSISSLPIDEDVAKDVWGHLPDKLRQQMTQYYKEDVMPKYSELLRLYYSSLSEKSANPMPKR